MKFKLLGYIFSISKEDEKKLEENKGKIKLKFKATNVKEERLAHPLDLSFRTDLSENKYKFPDNMSEENRINLIKTRNKILAKCYMEADYMTKKCPVCNDHITRGTSIAYTDKPYPECFCSMWNNEIRNTFAIATSVMNGSDRW